MNQSEPKFIGKRISVVRSKTDIVISISQQIERWQEALLVMWLAAWTFCGVVFIKYLIYAQNGSERFFFGLSSVLWGYFFAKIARVYLWRKGGREIIRLSEGKLTLINAYWKKGKPEDFKLHNIHKLGLVKSDATSFLAFLDNSFWIIGGDRVGFNYGSQKVRLGKQLSTPDAERLVRTIESGMREFNKKQN